MKNPTTLKISGKKYKRIPHTQESHWDDSHYDSAEDAKRAREECYDCGVGENKIHLLGCDHEECPKCLNQLISCDCNYENNQCRVPRETLAKLWGKIKHDEQSKLMRRKPEFLNGEKIIHFSVFSIDAWDMNGKKRKEKAISCCPRILSGQESFYRDDGSGECACCEAKIGEYHVPQCELEQCPECGGHFYNCGCELNEICQLPEDAFNKK